MNRAVIFDLEIEKAILGRNERPVEGVAYCKGWQDHRGMGISTLCAYDTASGRTRAFCKDNKDEFADLLVEADLIVGFNSRNFDAKVVLHSWGFSIPETKHYDIMLELAEGHGGDFRGLGLNAVVKMNLGPEFGKTGNGGLAPIDWQSGRIGSVIDYCLEDVRLTALLFSRILETGELLSPKTGAAIQMRNPFPKIGVGQELAS